MILLVTTLITVAFPIAWLAADLRSTAKMRRTIGVTAFVWSLFVLWLVGSLGEYNATVYCVSDTRRLLQESVRQLEVGKTEVVRRELTRANEQLMFSHDRPAYRQVVDQAVYGLKSP